VRERGSALMLMPAAVLLLFVLGAIAVDFALAFMAERELVNAAAAAANDAAVQAIDEARFYQEGVIALDADSARSAVDVALAARGASWLDPVEVVRVQIASDGSAVTVELRGRAPYVFAKAVPGAPEGVTVQAAATARPERA
jgi:Flp pilus assembly protein TadG